MHGCVGTDGQVAFLQLARTANELVDLALGFEEAFGKRVKAATKLGQDGFAACADEELGTASFFKFGNVIGNRRLGKRQALCGALEKPPDCATAWKA